MDNQSWGWFANIDDDSFIDFQVEEHSQKFTQQEELSEKFHNNPAPGSYNSLAHLFIIFCILNMRSIWHKFTHKKIVTHKHIYLYSIDDLSHNTHSLHIDSQSNILQLQKFFDLYNIGKIHSICVTHDSNVIQASVFWNFHNHTFKQISHKLNSKAHVRIPYSNVIVHY